MRLTIGPSPLFRSLRRRVTSYEIQCITKFFGLSKRRKLRKKSSDDKKIGDLDKKIGNSRISGQTLDMYDF